MTYEAQVLQKWSRTRTGYFLGTRTLGCILGVPKNFQKKKNPFLSFFFFFFWICHKNR